MIQKILTHKSKIIFATLFITIITTVTMCCSWNPFKSKNFYWNHYLHDYALVNFITNGSVINNRLLCTVQQGILIFDNLDTRPEIHTIVSMTSGYDYKPILTEGIVAYVPSFQNEHIMFARNFTGLGIPESLNGIFPSDFGEQFQDYSFRLIKNRQLDIGIFHGNRFITFISRFTSNVTGEHDCHIVYADLELDENYRIVITNSGFWEVQSMQEDGGIRIHSIISYKNSVFFTHSRDHHLVEITDNGIIKETPSPFGQEAIVTFFQYQGYLCAQLNTTRVVYTSDGENWYQAANRLEPLYYEFYEIDEYLFMHLNGTVVFLTGDITNLRFYELPTENMFGFNISSINKFNDNLVVTTSQGLFYIPWKNIDKDKILIGSANEGPIHFQGE